MRVGRWVSQSGTRKLRFFHVILCQTLQAPLLKTVQSMTCLRFLACLMGSEQHSYLSQALRQRRCGAQITQREFQLTEDFTAPKGALLMPSLIAASMQVSPVCLRS
jgi:hypothetical protein